MKLKFGTVTASDNNDSLDDINADAEKKTFFTEAARGKTLLHIVNLARFNPGIIMMMGEEGSGRSFLLKRLATRVNKKPGLLGIINHVVKTKLDLYLAIVEGFDLEIVENEHIDVLEERVMDFLQNSFVTHRPVIFAVEDVQQFSLNMLEELLKLLRRYRKITLLLVGDTNLSAMLKHMDTGKTVRHEISLQSLNRGEIRQFINWRLPFGIQDSEFEDIVNTTKGNFALLEREAQKKILAHQDTQVSKGEQFVQMLRSKSLLLLICFILVVFAGGAIFYLKNDDGKLPFMSAEPEIVQTAKEKTKEETVATPDAALTEKNPSSQIDTGDAMLDRQLALLEAATPSTKPEETPIAVVPKVVEAPVVTATIVEKTPVIVEKVPIVVEKAPVVVEKAPVVVEKTSAPAPVLPQVSPSVNVPDVMTGSEKDDSARLLAMDPSHYSVQVLGNRSKKIVDQFITTHSELKLLYFRSEKDGKDWYIVLYGEHDTSKAAVEASKGLPDDIKKTSPWARKLSDIQSLIKARTPR